MPEIFQTNYQSFSDMDQEVTPVLWKNFNVIVAGRTNGAHEPIVARLHASRHTQVSSTENSHYLLVFCPVASRVGTDISEALEIAPDGKPVILVVMHHTFDPDHIVAESRKQVDNANVRLTVDCLFHEGKLLSCNRNDIAWNEIQKFLGLPVSPVPQRLFSSHRRTTGGFINLLRLIVVISLLVIALFMIITIIIVEELWICENCTNIHDHNKSLMYNPD